MNLPLPTESEFNLAAFTVQVRQMSEQQAKDFLVFVARHAIARQSIYQQICPGCNIEPINLSEIGEDLDL